MKTRNIVGTIAAILGLIYLLFHIYHLLHTGKEMIDNNTIPDGYDEKTGLVITTDPTGKKDTVTIEEYSRRTGKSYNIKPRRKRGNGGDVY